MHTYSAPKGMDLHYQGYFIHAIMISFYYQQMSKKRIIVMLLATAIILELHLILRWKIGGKL